MNSEIIITRKIIGVYVPVSEEGVALTRVIVVGHMLYGLFVTGDCKFGKTVEHTSEPETEMANVIWLMAIIVC